MAITSLATYKAAKKYQAIWQKPSGTSVAGVGYDYIATAGLPTAGVLAGTNASSGVLLTNATAGFIKLPDVVNNTLYITGAESHGPTSSNSGNVFKFYDWLWKAGTFAYNVTAGAISGMPDFSGRLPNGSYKDVHLFFEVTTVFVGIPTLSVSYTNQDGTSGRTATVAGSSAMPVNQIRRFTLEGADTGVQSIQSVTGTVATGGAFNLILARPLFDVNAPAVGRLTNAKILDLPPIQIYPTSAIMPMVYAASTSTNNHCIILEVSDG